MVPALAKIRRAFVAALQHDVFGTAKAAAYSAILCLFPTILLITTVLALAPDTVSVRGELKTSFTELLPTDTMALLHSYFSNQRVHSEQVLVSSTLISLLAAMGVMLSLMEGFRKAYELPRREWPFWMERLVAFALIPSCLAPMAFATVIVAFGHQIEIWVITNTDHILGTYVLVAWRAIRWTIGLLTTICVLAVVYHFGTPRRQVWRYVIPGAVGAAFIWFLTTLLYGFYVTRFANYSVVYGSLGTVVATLVWLYITWLSVLLGAEFNAQFYPKPQRPLLKPAHQTTQPSDAAQPMHTRAF
jgi:membrane protein